MSENQKFSDTFSGSIEMKDNSNRDNFYIQYISFEVYFLSDFVITLNKTLKVHFVVVV